MLSKKVHPAIQIVNKTTTNNNNDCLIFKGYDATCTTAGLTDGKKCAVCGEITVSQTSISAKGHKEGEKITVVSPTKSENGKWEIKCAVCGEVLSEGIISATGSIGLEYTLNDKNTEYHVTGIGTCTDEDVCIPGEYKGLPVTKIGFGAFGKSDGSYDPADYMKSLTILEGIKIIEQSAFYGCWGLETVRIPASLETLVENLTL